MSSLRLVWRTLWYFRLSNLAVLAGIAVGTAVLSGSLLVGDSVRCSLRRIVEKRLGDVDYVLLGERPFTDSLAHRLSANARFRERFDSVEALLTVTGNAAGQGGSTIATGVQVFGRAGIAPGSCVVGHTLAHHLQAGPGETIVLRMGTFASVLPADSKRGEVALLRVRISRVAEPMSMEDAFSIQPTQRPVRNVWVSLSDLQESLDLRGKANLLFASTSGKARSLGYLDDPYEVLRPCLTVEDYGMRLVESPAGAISVEFDELLLHGAAMRSFFEGRGQGVFAYLVNSIEDIDSGREAPYSMVAGIDGIFYGEPPKEIPSGGILVNRWAADDLVARVGHTMRLRYYVRGRDGLLHEESEDFKLAGIVPMSDLWADRFLVPQFKGLTDARSMSTWNPPRDLQFQANRIRPIDEDYWKRYGPAPKAFVRLQDAWAMWAPDSYTLTAFRIHGRSKAQVAEDIRRNLEPPSRGLVWRAIRAEQLHAATGSTDFAGLFVGFSFFLIIASALLVVLFLRLSVEQRSRHVAVMLATGFTASRLRQLFLAEAAIPLALGCLVGLLGSVGYAWLMIVGLKTLWNEAIGTRVLALDVRWQSLAISLAAALALGTASIWLGLRRLRSTSVAGLLSGNRTEPIDPYAPAPTQPPTIHSGAKGPAFDGTRARKPALWHWAFLATVLLLMTLELFAESVSREVAFFGAGVISLIMCLVFLHRRFLRPVGRRDQRRGRFSLFALGVRNAARNPTRSALTLSLVASAAFVLVTVGSMKGRSFTKELDKAGATGGFALIAEFDVPIPYDLNTPEGRRLLALKGEESLWRRVRFFSLRRSTGGDISCRNLYVPTEPRIMAIPDDFIADSPFSFAASLRKQEAAWRLLCDRSPDGIGVIADADTARWILHAKLGDHIRIRNGSGQEETVRLAALLRKSIFQGELLMGERDFRRLFPGETGFRQVLVRASPADATRAAELLRQSLSDYGVNVETTTERLAYFSRIEDSYLSAFEALGGLGMLLGSLGLAVVLVRGVIERRAELALLTALGFRKRSLLCVVVSENAALFLLGLLAGTIPALVAVMPELLEASAWPSLFALALGLLPATGVLVLIVLVGVSSFLLRRLSPAALRLE